MKVFNKGNTKEVIVFPKIGKKISLSINSGECTLPDLKEVIKLVNSDSDLSIVKNNNKPSIKIEKEKLENNIEKIDVEEPKKTIKKNKKHKKKSK